LYFILQEIVTLYLLLKVLDITARATRAPYTYFLYMKKKLSILYIIPYFLYIRDPLIKVIISLFFD